MSEALMRRPWGQLNATLGHFGSETLAIQTLEIEHCTNRRLADSIVKRLIGSAHAPLQLADRRPVDYDCLTVHRVPSCRCLECSLRSVDSTDPACGGAFGSSESPSISSNITWG